MAAAPANRWPTLSRSHLVAHIERHLTTVPPGAAGVALSGPAGAGASVLLELVARRHPGLTVRHRRVRPTGASAASRALADLAALVGDLPAGALIGIDGLEEIDEETAADIAELTAGHRITVLATVRARTAARLPTSRHPLRHLQVTAVPPLSGEQVDRLCAARLGAPLEPLTLRRLVDLSDGWPAPLVAVVEHNLSSGSLRLRRGLFGAADLTVPPGLTGPGSPLVHALSAPARAVLDAAADGPLARTEAETVAGREDVDGLLADGLLQTTVEAADVLVGLTDRARDLVVVAGPVSLAERTASIRADLRLARPAAAAGEAVRLRDDGIRARRPRETAAAEALLAEALLEQGLVREAEATVHQALCLLETGPPTDPLFPDCLSLAALCAAWRGAGTPARRLADEAESHLRSSGGRAAGRLAEVDLLLGDAGGAVRRAHRVAVSATAPDIVLAASTVVARAGFDRPGGERPDDPRPVEDTPLYGLVRALRHSDGQALLQLARTWTATGSALLAADVAARAEPLLRAAGDGAAAGRAGHLVASVLAAAGIPRPAGWPSPTTGGLTTRERQVADLVTAGATAAEAAATLHLSVRTVENHLQHCYTKCGVNGRLELAAALGFPAAAPVHDSPSDHSPAAAVRPPGTGDRAGSTRVPATAVQGWR